MEKYDVKVKKELGPEILTPTEEGDEDEETETEMQDESLREDISDKNIICLNCGQEVNSKDDLIEHIGQNIECLHHYGVTGLEKLKFDTPRELSVKYQVDDNIACAPVVEDGCSKLDHSMIEDIRTLPVGKNKYFYML